MEQSAPLKQERSDQAHVSVYVGRAGCSSGKNVLCRLQGFVIESFRWAHLENEDPKIDGEEDGEEEQ